MKKSDELVYIGGARRRVFRASDFTQPAVGLDKEVAKDLEFVRPSAQRMSVGEVGTELAEWLITNHPAEFKVVEKGEKVVPGGDQTVDAANGNPPSTAVS